MTDLGIFKALQKASFSILIFLLPTQLALHLWPSWSHVFGIRVDYLAPTLYLTDILVFSLLFLWTIERIGWAKASSQKKVGPVVLFAFFIFVLANIFVAANFQAAIYKWVKVFELFLFTLFVATKRGFVYKNWVVEPLAFSIIFFSLIATLQFILQRTLGGPFYFLGERSFDVSTPGVALLNFSGRKLLRAYSTFPHPNSLAGFMLVGATLIYSSKQNKFLTKAALFFSGISLFISFSLAAWVAAGLVGLFYLVLKVDKKLFRRVALTFMFVSVVASLTFPFWANRLISERVGIPREIFERVSLAKASTLMFSKSPFLGVGLNNFVVKLPKTLLEPEVSWSLQPVHNIFLLSLSEVGLLGLLVFTFIFWVALEKSTRGKNFLTLSFLAILLTGVVDHYWLTLQQNQLLFSLILGLSFRKS